MEYKEFEFKIEWKYEWMVSHSSTRNTNDKWKEAEAVDCFFFLMKKYIERSGGTQLAHVVTF